MTARVGVTKYLSESNREEERCILQSEAMQFVGAAEAWQWAATQWQGRVAAAGSHLRGPGSR